MKQRRSKSLKMNKLASIINSMNEEKSHQAPSLYDKGIGDKIAAGFAKFASPKKGNRAANVDVNGCAKIANKNQHNRSANDDNKDGFAQSMIEAKQEIGVNVGGDKSGFAKNNFLVKNTKKRSRPASANTEKAGFTDVKSNEELDFTMKTTEKTQSAERGPTKPASAGDEDGYAPISQAKMRRFRSPTESIPAKSAECVLTKPVQHISTQSAVRVPTKPASAGVEDGYAPISQVYALLGPGQHNSTQSAEPTKPGHQNSTQLGQRIPAQSEHSPVLSRQRTSHSGQTTPNQSRESRQLTPQSQSRHGTPNISASAANNYIYWNIGSTDSDGRTRVEVINKVLEPSHECSSKIRKIMYEKLEPTGYNWKSISKETRDFYFEEFKKYFVWRQSDAVIYEGWLANARRKYSELCSVAHSSWEKHEQPDKRISMDVYLSWIEFWETPKFQKKSEIQKINRSSGVDGNLSTHTSGSASHRTIAARAQMKYQCDPTADQIFLITHLKNPNIKKIMCGEDDVDEENGENCNDERIWVDKKSQLTYEIFERLCEEQVKAGLTVDRNALFLEAAGGFDKKKRVYGVGSSQDLFYRRETVPCSSSFANVENHKLREELKVVKDKMNTMENQIAKILEMYSFRLAQSPTIDVDDVDGQNDDDGNE